MTAKDKYYKMLEQKGSLAKWMVNIGIADNLVDAETLEATLSTFTCDFSYPSKTFLMLEIGRAHV